MITNLSIHSTLQFTFLEQNQQRYEYTRLILTSLIIFDFVEVLMVFEGNMCIHIFYIMKQKIICICLQSHSDYSSVSNTRTAWNKHTGRPILGLPVFLFDTLLNKNPKTVSNKAVQVGTFWQNK